MDNQRLYSHGAYEYLDELKAKKKDFVDNIQSLILSERNQNEFNEDDFSEEDLEKMYWEDPFNVTSEEEYIEHHHYLTIKSDSYENFKEILVILKARHQ